MLGTLGLMLHHRRMLHWRLMLHSGLVMHHGLMLQHGLIPAGSVPHHPLSRGARSPPAPLCHGQGMPRQHPCPSMGPLQGRDSTWAHLAAVHRR